VFGFVNAAQPSDDTAEDFADGWCESQTDKIEAALREYATTQDNPCGGCGYYDAGEAKPWRVLFADGAACESFATLDAAIEAADAYADEMDAEKV
jgi:hypothetical protein